MTGAGDDAKPTQKRLRLSLDPKPVSEIIDRAILEYRTDQETEQSRKAKAISTKPLTPSQIKRLTDSVAAQPHYIGRVAAECAGPRRHGMASASNGSTTRTLIQPGAAIEDEQKCHERLGDYLEGEVVYCGAKHLQWHDIPGNELTSFSASTLFLTVFALQKRAVGASKIKLHYVDTKAARRLDGSPAAFYSAAVLYAVLELNDKHPAATYRLEDDSMFTHELLARGVIVLKRNNVRPADIEELLDQGLRKLLPRFTMKKSGKMPSPSGIRELGFPRSAVCSAGSTTYEQCRRCVLLSQDQLETARSVALCFLDEPHDSGKEPPLHIFLQMLCFKKRKRGERRLADWITSKYSGEHC